MFPWYRILGKRLVKAPKGYIADTSLICHMLDLDIDAIATSKPDLFDHLLENFVAKQLTKPLTFSNTRAQLFHFRTSDRKEVDFVLEKPDGSLFGIEVK
nr:DUF4143 domain-containing protein [Flavihumibacter petaseus]